jgi:hypothetical protein
MIIEDECGQDLNNHVYDFMGHLVRPQWCQELLARFIECYHKICDSDVHDDLQKDVVEELWSWNG